MKTPNQAEKLKTISGQELGWFRRGVTSNFPPAKSFYFIKQVKNTVWLTQIKLRRSFDDEFDKMEPRTVRNIKISEEFEIEAMK